MARSNEGWVGLGPLKGQNTSDNPLTLGEGWATDTLNIVLDPQSSVAVKRYGSSALVVPTGTYNMARHVAIGSNEANDELWAFALNADVFEMWRKIGAGAFTKIPGVPAAIGYVIRALSFNGKLFFAAWTTGVNRMFLWDGTQFRKVGLVPGVNAPTAVSFGTTTNNAYKRTYKVDWVYLNGLQTQARSELSPASPEYLPPGNTGMRVTRPAVSEYATHWRVWGAAEGGIYFKLSDNIAVATTTFDDMVHPLAYSGEAAPEIGLYLPPPAVTRLITDGHRILMSGNGSFLSVGGQGETQPRTNRVWYTPVLGALDQGDDERIPHTSDQRNFLDVGDPPTGDIIELGGPMEGQIFAFSRNRPWRLIPTGDLTTPYLTYPVTSVFGAGENPTFTQAAVALGETETGQPAIYFFDIVAGMYRITSGEDVQFVSYDIQNEVNALRPRFSAGQVVFSWPEAKQTWWLIPLASPHEVRIYVFHWPAGNTEAQRVNGGWTKWVHAESPVQFSAFVLHNRTPGLSTSQGRARVPYASPNIGSTAYTFDRATALDGNTPYSGSVTCAPLLPANAHEQIRVMPPTLVVTPHAGVNMRVSATRDFGTETRVCDISLTPAGSETAVVRTAESLFSADVTALQISVADAVANSALWQVYLATVPVGKHQPR